MTIQNEGRWTSSSSSHPLSLTTGHAGESKTKKDSPSVALELPDCPFPVGLRWLLRKINCLSPVMTYTVFPCGKAFSCLWKAGSRPVVTMGMMQTLRLPLQVLMPLTCPVATYRRTALVWSALLPFLPSQERQAGILPLQTEEK